METRKYSAIFSQKIPLHRNFLLIFSAKVQCSETLLLFQVKTSTFLKLMKNLKKSAIAEPWLLQCIKPIFHPLSMFVFVRRVRRRN